MRKDKLTILTKLLEENLQDKEKTEKALQENLNRISEIDSFLDSIYNNEKTDFQVFSPRSAEIIHKEKIEKAKEERDNLEYSNNSYYQKLKKLEKQIKNLSMVIEESKDTDQKMHLAVLDIQEKERVRIARELHDSSLQNLTHLIHTLELSSLFIDQDPIRAKLELSACSQNLKQIIDEIRDTIFNLRPMSFDDLGFEQCIENFIDVMKQQFKDYEIIFDIDDVSMNLEDTDQKNTFDLFLVTVYRVIQEAMINSLKHSNGSTVELCIQKSEKDLLIKIKDNGEGFVLDREMVLSDEKSENKDNKHFGISIMRERIYLLGGKLEIDSKPGQGTLVFISVPLP